MFNKDDLNTTYNKLQTDIGKSIKSYPWEDKNTYIIWLANTYHYVTNSTRILSLAAGLMPSNKTYLSNRFIAHAAEEKNHEKLIENDLRSFNVNVEDIQVSVEMKFFYRSLYYWLSNVASPIGLYGWILTLEGIAVSYGDWTYDIVSKNHGEKAASFLKLHSSEDPDHLDKAFQTIANFDSEEISIVCDSLKSYSQQYINILGQIKQTVFHRQTL